MGGGDITGKGSKMGGKGDMAKGKGKGGKGDSKGKDGSKGKGGGKGKGAGKGKGGGKGKGAPKEKDRNIAEEFDETTLAVKNGLLNQKWKFTFKETEKFAIVDAEGKWTFQSADGSGKEISGKLYCKTGGDAPAVCLSAYKGAQWLSNADWETYALTWTDGKNDPIVWEYVGEASGSVGGS